ncbi:MAG: tetratricopeptide repeat protein [Bacteroidota bacterium]|nr:tetratricopeptide repeat protein [Bacteroidota bacterium]
MKSYILAVLFFLTSAMFAFSQEQPRQFNTDYAKALAEFEQKNYTNTLNILTNALNSNNTYSHYYLLRGDAYYRLEKYSKAKNDYLDCRRISKELAGYRLAKTYAQLGENTKALEYLKIYLDKKNKVALSEIKTEQAFSSGSKSKAWKTLFREKHYKTSEITLDRVHYLIRMEKYTEAYNIVTNRLQKYKKDDRAYSLLGDIFFIKGQYKQAAKNYSKAVKYERKNIPYYKKRALAYSKLRKYNKAADNFREIISISPNEIKYYYPLAQAEYNNQSYDKALADIGTYKAYFNTSDADYLQGLILQKTDNNLSALHLFNQCIEQNNSEYLYFKARAQSHLSAEMFKAAENDLSMALDLRPSGELYYLRAKVRKLMHNYTGACQDIKKAEYHKYYKASDLRDSNCR